jgi:uncharacterized protein (UPF0335 family)
MSTGHNSDMPPHAAAQLKSFVERIERLDKDIKAFNDDKSEVYKEAKGYGYDVKIIRKVIAIRRQSTHDRSEQEALIDLYLNAVGSKD